MLQVSPDEITDDTHPAGLEPWDSLQHLMLVSGFEEEFGVDVDPEESVEMYRDFATFKNIIVRKLQSTRRA